MITIFGCVLVGIVIALILSPRYADRGENGAAGGFYGFMAGCLVYGLVGNYALEHEDRSRGSEAVIMVGTEGDGRQAYLREDLSTGVPHFLLYRRDATGIRALRIPADDRTVIRETPGADASIETICPERGDPDGWFWGVSVSAPCRYVVTLPVPAPVALTASR